MFKTSSVKKKVILLLAIFAITFVFAGCTNKPKDQDKPSTQSHSKDDQNKKFNTEDMKKNVQDTIKPLVDDKTLTQDQADKIVEAISTRPNKNPNIENNTPSTNNENPPNSTNSNNNEQKQNTHKNNFANSALSKLVSDGVITQAQADAVTNKIKENFKKSTP